MRMVAVNLVLSALLVAAALLAYERLVARPHRMVGVVDLGEVYRLKEAQFSQMLIQPGPQAERQKALALAQAFAQRLPRALEELALDCNCVVLPRSAVAGMGPDMVDLTTALRQKVEAP